MFESFQHIGELAALGTATCWAGSSLCFEAGGKRIGSLVVNWFRLVVALTLLTLATFLFRGRALPLDATSHAWMWLSISGLIGFVFGDLCLFRALVVLGSRLAVLVMSLVPPLTVLLGWLILDEKLAALDMLAIAITVLGIATAVSERPGTRPRGRIRGESPGGQPCDEPPDQRGGEPGTDNPPASKIAIRPVATTGGVLLAAGGALGQSGGLVLSKLGMGSYHAMAATQVRIIAGLVGFSVLFTIIGWWPRVWAARRHREGLGATALGACFGPFVGVSLSLYAVQHTSTGIASSIMATTPVLIIPLVAVIHKEPITTRGVVGALAALTGVTLLFTT